MEKNNCNYSKDTASVPFYAFESSNMTHELHERRIWKALIVTIALLFISNIAWLIAWVQYDYESEETIVKVESEQDGNANYIGNDGDIINGACYGYQEEEEENAD